MVLTPHSLIGAAAYALSPNPFMGLPLAFLSHFLGDMIPHAHYHIQDPVTKEPAFSLKNVFTVGADLFIGITLCAGIAFAKHDVFFIAAGFLAMLPDGFSFIVLAAKKWKGILLFANILTPVQFVHHHVHSRINVEKFGMLPQIILCLIFLAVLIFS